MDLKQPDSAWTDRKAASESLGSDGIQMRDLGRRSGGGGDQETKGEADPEIGGKDRKAVAPEFTAPQGVKFCCDKLEYGWQPWHILPYHPSVYKRDLVQLKDEVFAGLAVAFAQVSDSIAFAFIAGVGPLLGLHAAWIIGLSLSVFGSRPAMMNGATGVRAAVLKPYVSQYGIGYLFYIVFIISFFQLAAGFFKLAKLIRLVPRPAMIGFVNGLAIIFTLGQIQQFEIPCDPPETSMSRPVPSQCTSANPPSKVYIEGAELIFMWVHIVVVCLAIKLIPKTPKYGKYIPASLSGIMLSTIMEWAFIRPSSYRTPVIGEVGKVSGGFPLPFFMDPQYDGQIAPLTWDTIKVCILPAFIAAAAGAVEAVMTMEVVNDLTETGNEAPNQQLIALSIGNAASAILGTMGGGATIGLSILNVKSGANGYYRLSGHVSGIVVLLFVLVASSLIEIIPTASLVGVMIIIILETFDWESLMIITVTSMPQSWRHSACWLRLAQRFSWLNPKRKIERLDAIVVVLVTVVTLVQDLFVAVLAGILLTAAGFAWNVGERISYTTRTETKPKLKKIYQLRGPLFFASAQRFATWFDARNDPDLVEVHFDRDGTELSDYSGIHALNVVGQRYKKYGKRLMVRYLNKNSLRMLAKGDNLRRHFDLISEASVGDELKNGVDSKDGEGRESPPSLGPARDVDSPKPLVRNPYGERDGVKHL